MIDTPNNDARLVRFLLGHASEEERQAIERECLRADGEAFAEIVAFEDELRVAYAQGRLSPGDRGAFERRYLTTLSDRAKLAFARALGRLADREAAGRAAIAPVPVALSWWRRPAVLIGLAAATVVLGIATGFLILTNRRLQQNIAQHPAQAIVKPEAHPIVALTLLPGLTRSAGAPMPRVSADDAWRGLRITLTLPAAAAPAASYRAVLRDADGHQLQDIGGLGRRDTGVDLAIPASTLLPGDYELTLRGVETGGHGQDVASYYLRVLAR